jgi:hypothetical protein
MMGGIASGSHHDTSVTGAAMAQATSIGAVSYIDPGTITNAGLMQTGVSNGSFRLPDITMNSLSSQPKNDVSNYLFENSNSNFVWLLILVTVYNSILEQEQHIII